MIDGAAETGGAVRELLESAGVRSIAVDGLADDQRSLALELAAYATLRASSADADAVATLATTSAEETILGLDAATKATPRLVIVLDPVNRRRADVERWAAVHDGWLVLDRPPLGIEVLAPIETVVSCENLHGVWRGGPQTADEATSPGPLISAQTPRVASEKAGALGEPKSTAPRAETDHQTAYLRAHRLQLRTESQRIEIDRLRAELITQRAWAATEAKRVLASSSWRLGHRLVRIIRLVTFRRDKGSDALTRMVERMSAPIDN